MVACPRCRTELARTHGEEGNAWTCASCGGRAVSIAVLRKTTRADVASGIWQDARLRPAAGDLACPWCARPMERVADERVSPGAELDVCVACQFVWFDAAEGEGLPAPERPEPERLSPASAQALAVAQVRWSQARFVDEPDESGFLTLATGLPRETGVPQPERRPWVTWALAIAAIAATMATSESVLDFIAGGDDPSDARLAWGFLPSDPWRHGGLTWLTAFALHVNLIHLAFNLYFLLLVGDDVEDRLGPLRFLGLVGLSTVAGSALHAVLTSNPDAVVMGSSDAVCGVAVFYVIAFPRACLQFPLLWSSRASRPVGLRWVAYRARFVVLLFLAVETILAALEVPGVSHAAHLGGAAAGLVVVLLARAWTASTGVPA